MSYDISFCIKVDGTNIWFDTGYCDRNITWNLQEMITESTGLKWGSYGNIGLVKDIIPKIEAGLKELKENGEKYRKYESPNGWGSVENCAVFFKDIISDWDDLLYFNEQIKDYVTFWIL